MGDEHGQDKKPLIFGCDANLNLVLENSRSPNRWSSPPEPEGWRRRIAEQGRLNGINNEFSDYDEQLRDTQHSLRTEKTRKTEPGLSGSTNTSNLQGLGKRECKQDDKRDEEYGMKSMGK